MQGQKPAGRIRVVYPSGNTFEVFARGVGIVEIDAESGSVPVVELGEAAHIGDEDMKAGDPLVLDPRAIITAIGGENDGRVLYHPRDPEHRPAGWVRQWLRENPSWDRREQNAATAKQLASAHSRYTEALEWQLKMLDFWLSDEGRETASAYARANPGRGAVKALWAAQIQHLAEAETFYVAPSICRLLTDAGVDFPDAALSSEVIPASSGFIWFSDPINVPVFRSDTEPDNPSFCEPLRVAMWINDRERSEVRVTFYCGALGQSPVLASSLMWKHGETWWSDWHDRANRDETSIEEAGRLAAMRRTLLMFFLFVNQRITQSVRQRADRATRRRLERYGVPHEPVVQIVELRRREHHSRETGEHRDVEWSCQWIVRGHWHRYRTNDGLQPRWISPYVKGPDDKPLKKPRAEVFAVVR